MISFCPENLCDTIQVSGSLYIFGSIYIVDFGRWKTLKNSVFSLFSIPLKNHPKKFRPLRGRFLSENTVVQIVFIAFSAPREKTLFFAQKYNSLFIFFTISEPTTFSTRFQILKNAAKKNVKSQTCSGRLTLMVSNLTCSGVMISSSS